MGAHCVAAQECNSLQNATPITLVAYLDGVLPKDGNAACITVAIDSLTPLRFEPAIPGLVKLLDFRRSLNEKVPQRRQLTLEFMYPAAAALEEIGKKALPAVLHAIKSSTSTKGRENAVAVWMEINKYDAPKGVALLRQEAVEAEDATTKANLKWALSKALDWCNPDDILRCSASAVMPKP